MTEETQVETPIEDAPVLEADSSPAEEVEKETPDDVGEQPRDEDGKFLSAKAQKRIDELTWRANENERQAAFWRAQAEARQAQEPPKVEPPLKAPTLEEVGYDEAKYQAAVAKYATELARAEVRKELEADRSRMTEQQRIEAFATRQQEFAKKTPDFESRVMRDPTLPITAAMRDVILDSPTGPEIAYYLATNREQAEQIARLPPHLAALEMGRIEGRMTAVKEAKTRPVVTKAPPPPPQIDAVDAEVTKDPENMSADEWAKWREKQLRKRK